MTYKGTDLWAFRAAMALRGETQRSLASFLKVSESRLSAKIRGKDGAQFTQVEIRAIAAVLKLTPEDIAAIFFPQVQR